MKLTIFAATGGIGRHLLDRALAAGHDATAVVRNPQTLPAGVVSAAPVGTVASPGRPTLPATTRATGRSPGTWPCRWRGGVSATSTTTSP